MTMMPTMTSTHHERSFAHFQSAYKMYCIFYVLGELSKLDKKNWLLQTIAPMYKFNTFEFGSENVYLEIKILQPAGAGSGVSYFS